MSNFIQTGMVDTFFEHSTRRKPAFLRHRVKFQKIFFQCFQGLAAFFAKIKTKKFYGFLPFQPGNPAPLIRPYSTRDQATKQDKSKIKARKIKLEKICKLDKTKSS